VPGPLTRSAAAAAHDFAAAGPAFAELERQGPIDWKAWDVAAEHLERSLAGTPGLERRIHHWYLPVLFFCLARLHHAKARPLVVGIQAPQGAGKTTLVTHLLSLLSALGLRGAAVSIDDFYLTRAEQLQLAAAHPGNPYLEHRGYPGTHDVALGETTLAALAALGPSKTVQVPVYDKSAHGGRGDRAPTAEWRSVTGLLDMILVEGWMLGFSPVTDKNLTDPNLVAPNHALAAYDRWHNQLDAFVVIRAADPSFVLRWRVEAEEAMKASGRPGLSRAAIEDYIRRFLPAYHTWAGQAPKRFSRDETFYMTLDAERQPCTAV
jgi:D-glycerate 3-kinase